MKYRAKDGIYVLNEDGTSQRVQCLYPGRENCEPYPLATSVFFLKGDRQEILRSEIWAKLKSYHSFLGWTAKIRLDGDNLIIEPWNKNYDIETVVIPVCVTPMVGYTPIEITSSENDQCLHYGDIIEEILD